MPDTDPTAPTPPVRPTTVTTFLKERTGLRVGEDAAALLARLLTAAAEKVADVAKELAAKEDRATLLDRDVQAGFEAFLGTAGPALIRPETLHAAIDGMDNDGFTQLINLLRADIEEAPR